MDVQLHLTTIELLKDIAKLNLEDDQPKLLEQLFRIPDFIPMLIMSCAQRLAKTTHEFLLNSGYLYNWLTLMTVTKSHLAIAFEKSEEKEKYVLLKILFIIVCPYAIERELLSLERDRKQDLNLIFKCMCLLSYIHRRFYTLLVIDRVVMRITLNIREVIYVDDTVDVNEESKDLAFELLSWRISG